MAVSLDAFSMVPGGKLTLLAKLTGELNVAAALTWRKSVIAEPRIAVPVTFSTAFGAMRKSLCSCTEAWKVEGAEKVEGAWKLVMSRKVEGAWKDDGA